MTVVAGGGPRPRSLLLGWVRAILLRQERVERLLLRGIVSVGEWQEEQGRADALHVIKDVLSALARRRFAADTDVRVLTAWVYEIHEVASGVPVLEGEALLRQALGEDVPTDDIPVVVALGACMGLLGGAYRDVSHEVDEVGLDEILVETERRAQKNGIRLANADSALRAEAG